MRRPFAREDQPATELQLKQLDDIEGRAAGIVHATVLSPKYDSSPHADIQMTKAIIDIATPLGIAVHDHIIVGKNGHASMKGLKLI